MRWTRQQEILSKDGQSVLGEQRLLQIGTGGIGSHFALIAAHVGFRHFTLVDPDTNQEENLNRSAQCADLGRPKVLCLKEQIERIDPEIVVQPHIAKIEEVSDLVGECTVIVSCPDNGQARIFANEQAIRHSKLLVDMGFGYAHGRMGCHASLYKPGGACLLCGSLKEGASPPSGSSFLPTMMIAASLGMEMLVDELTDYSRSGADRPNFLFYDAMERNLISLRRVPRDRCPCGRPIPMAEVQP